MTNEPPNNDRTSHHALHAASVAAIVIAGVTAYVGSFCGRFLFDNRHQILGSGRLRDLLSLSDVFGRSRPLVDYSFALNHAVGGESPWGYHVVNLTVHVLAALTLFGLVRRTLLRPGLRERFGVASAWLALTTALLWVVHPLQTQSVTYIIQRAESMMGLFYLLTLYCVVRGVDSDSPRRWFGLAVIACAMGMGSKAVMVTAPVMVLLYDRCFISGKTAEALHRRWGLYAGLASTWLLLWITGVAGDILDPTTSNTHVGFGVKDIAPIDYALTQFGVLLRYLQLSLWPRPLCLDYGWPFSKTVTAIAPPLVAIALLLGVTLRSLHRREGLGFLGAWFFLILLPTSSWIPISEPLVEHRMYLPLAGVIVLIVVGGYAVVRHRLPSVEPGHTGGEIPRTLIASLAIVAIASLGYTTIQRNRDYASESGMWNDVRAKRPGNQQAVVNHGLALIAEGKLAEALPVMREAVALRPDSAAVRNGLGLALAASGFDDDALEQFREAVRLSPNFVRALANLSAALIKRGRVDEATPYFKHVLSIDPNHEGARLDLGVALLSKHEFATAIGQFQAVTKVNPNSSIAWGYLGTALANAGRLDDALPALSRAVELNGGSAQLLTSLGAAHFRRREWDDAIEAFRRALLIEPKYTAAHVYLGRTFFEMGDFQGAATHFAIVVELQPDDAASHYELGVAWEKQGKPAKAHDEFEKALQLNPNLQRAMTALERVQKALPESGEQP